MKRLLSIILLAVALMFTACEKETNIDKPATTNKVEFVLTNLSSYSSSPVVVSYGGDFGNYQTPYIILDTLYESQTLEFNSEFITDYLFINTLQTNQQIATDESSKTVHIMVIHPSGYNTIISKTDSICLTIINK